jgi:hypothetical protein
LSTKVYDFKKCLLEREWRVRRKEEKEEREGKESPDFLALDFSERVSAGG